MNTESVDGILLDLGLSSIQLEGQERGFSFRGESPLDMRMDQRTEETAADLVNHPSSKRTGRDPLDVRGRAVGKRIARAIVDERDRRPIETTQALSKIVYQAIPRRFQSRRLDPATRTFQALRIRVNHELENLRAGA